MKKKINLKNVIKAHEKTGHTTLSEHHSRMHAAVNKAIQTDERFNKKAAPQTEGVPYNQKPYCIDITTADVDDVHHAIVNTADGRLVRHPFDFNHDEGTVKLAEGDSTPTERSTVYATAIEQHETILKAVENVISCRASTGVKLAASEPWVAGESVSYIYVPGGVHTINAGFRKSDSITCTVEVDENTAKDLQNSFDHIAATEKQEPYADEDHESKKATLRFPPNKVEFTYGTHRGEEGVIVSGAEPTSYGAEAVNGKVYASWSPEFATDADYSKAKCKKGHWTFPDGVRGSASNPARLVAVNFVTGALTNKPAFKAMPNVKARHVDPETGEMVEDDMVMAGTPAGNKNAAGKHLVVYPNMSGAAPKLLMGKDYAAFLSNKAHKSSSLADDTGDVFHHAEARSAHDSAALAHHKWGDKEKEKEHKEKATHHWNKVTSKFDSQQATDTTESDTIQAAWSEAARKAASEARSEHAASLHSQLVTKFSGIEGHEHSARAHRLSVVAYKSGHHADHADAAAAHELAQAACSSTGRHDTATEHDRHAMHHHRHAQTHGFSIEHTAHAAMTAKDSTKTSTIQAGEHKGEKCKFSCEIFPHPGRTLKGKEKEQSAKFDDEDGARKWHEEKKKEYGTDLNEGHSRIHRHVEGITASESHLMALDTLYARNSALHTAAENIAMKQPQVVAREAEKAKPADASVEAVLARRQENENFQQKLLARNPLLANRAAIEAISARGMNGAEEILPKPDKATMDKIYSRLKPAANG